MIEVDREMPLHELAHPVDRIGEVRDDANTDEVGEHPQIGVAPVRTRELPRQALPSLQSPRDGVHLHRWTGREQLAELADGIATRPEEGQALVVLRKKLLGRHAFHLSRRIQRDDALDDALAVDRSRDNAARIARALATREEAAHAGMLERRGVARDPDRR